MYKQMRNWTALCVQVLQRQQVALVLALATLVLETLNRQETPLPGA